ncbi:hypothetical protein HPP92_015052 [Vanilla planifolia]|uniref:Uncharacterized protein n=1 Tax=Vanilla planifolia TaxID=51239 RepID=A0A835QI50_VANPL|nr:hypothetical protein HPP92_015563 [Vanilla planifolia]KAG0475366.1 hypothetical protein HPP92_015052 [Vanilla planifolia]
MVCWRLAMPEVYNCALICRHLEENWRIWLLCLKQPMQPKDWVFLKAGRHEGFPFVVTGRLLGIGQSNMWQFSG